MRPIQVEPLAPPSLRSGGGGAGRIAVAVAVAHGVTDSYAAFLHPLLPRLMGRLGLSIALAATLAMVLSLATSLLQPLMGYLADRYGRRLFVVLGPLLSGVFLSLIGNAGSLPALLVLLGLGGLGAAAFHPPGASLAGRAGGAKGSGLRLSIFSFGGSAGFALGPLVAVGLVAHLGLEMLWVAMVPGILMAGVLLLILPAGRADREPEPPPSPRSLLGLLRGPLGLLFGVSAIGAFVQRTFLTMTPIANAAEGGTEAAGALLLTVYLGGQAVGSLVGGTLADRLDRRRLLASLALVGLPAHVLALALPLGSAGGLAATALAGLVNMALLPPLVVMAQEIVPAGAAVSSGIVMGLAWAAGSVGVLGTGLLGDVFGARAAALACFPVLLVAVLLARSAALAPHAQPGR